MDFTLPRERIIRKKLDIGALLEKGESHFKHPLKATCVLDTTFGEARMMVSVPKRNFKHAVDRNLLKRRIREAFRRNRALLGGRSVDILFVYLAKEKYDYERIEASIVEILGSIAADSAR